MEKLELTGTSAGQLSSDPSEIPKIPFRMGVLPNGLTLIVHEDRRHPLVATQLRYNVGSKDEPPGRTGFAHLFEHLMFKQSAHRQGNWHNMLQSMGGTGVNATTNFDRTNYFQTVPIGALDQLLWMESDRMGHLLAGIDAAALADEVLVVKNEKRQREGAPYGGMLEAITTALYPREHPYGHTVLGSFEDLDNANMETVKGWYASWYGASNAVLAISGDISFEDALAKVEHWFGGMPTGTPVSRVTQWLPEVRHTRRVTLYDRVPSRLIRSIWSTPNANDPDSSILKLIAQILASGPHSRLVRRLVSGENLCLSISAHQDERYLCGEFSISATLAPNVDPAAVDAAITEEFDRLIAEGPTQEELDGVRRANKVGLLRMLDDIAYVAETLASNMILFGSPDGHLRLINTVEQATTETIRDVAARWLAHKALELDVRPFEAVAVANDPTERTVAPAVGIIHAPPFPKVEYARLPNGLSIWFARQPGTQGIDFALHIGNGSKADPLGLEGVSLATLALLVCGTERWSKQDLAEMLARTGVQYVASAGKDFTTLAMNALKADTRQAMHLMAEFFTEPAFPKDELRQFIERQIASNRRRANAPVTAAEMAITRLIYGPAHDYGRPGAGTEETLSAITRDHVVACHQGWLDPRQATLIVVGDLEIAEVTALAEEAFAAWAPHDVKAVVRNSVWEPAPGRYFISRHGSTQSALHMAVASPDIVMGNEALQIFNNLFGGTFGSRLNTNLRERRGWTYGAYSRLSISPQIGAFQISTEVQADRTMDALAEIELELAALVGKRRISSAEIEEARRALLVALPSRWASNGAVLNALINRISHGLPEDYDDGIEARIRSVAPDDVELIANSIGNSANYSSVVAGDPREADGGKFMQLSVPEETFADRPLLDSGG